MPDDQNSKVVAAVTPPTQTNNAPIPVQPMPVASTEEKASATEALYKQNVEMAFKNKALSLLGDLYKISVLALEPAALAEKISKVIRERLEFEVVELFQYHEDAETSFSPLHYSYSDGLTKVCNELSCTLQSTSLPSKMNALIQGITDSKNPLIGETLRVIWGGNISDEVLDKIDSATHIKTVMAFPLIIEGKIIGLVVMAFNRAYETLIDFEKETISNVVNVVAVALDKALLYKELEDANESLKSLDKLKTEFLGLASHQLRAPLTSIKGYSSMMLEGSYGEVPAGQKMPVERIFQSSQNLAQVVEDLLDVSKIEQGGMKFEMSATDMKKITTDLAAEFQVAAKNKNLTVTLEEKDFGTYVAKADPVKIRQVILNLVDNSIKYTQSGFVKIILSMPVTGMMRISVTDSGMGIPPEIIGHLFEKFSRGEGGKVNAGGSGLGLYLAKEIVLAHSGKIWAESPGRGQGSSFIVELPEVAAIPDHRT